MLISFGVGFNCANQHTRSLALIFINMTLIYLQHDFVYTIRCFL